MRTPEFTSGNVLARLNSEVTHTLWPGEAGKEEETRSASLCLAPTASDFLAPNGPKRSQLETRTFCTSPEPPSHPPTLWRQPRPGSHKAAGLRGRYRNSFKTNDPLLRGMGHPLRAPNCTPSPIPTETGATKPKRGGRRGARRAEGTPGGIQSSPVWEAKAANC